MSAAVHLSPGPTKLPPVLRMALLEWRMRLRRPTTLWLFVGLLLCTFWVIADPAHGFAMIHAKGARVLQDSPAQSLGSATMLNLMLMLFGFAVARGRTTHDLNHHMLALTASSGISHGALVAGRWLGAVLHLTTLSSGFFAGAMVQHLLHGEGPLQPLTYLLSYLWVSGPTVLFVASLAMCLDQVPSLMGKRGEVAYFFFWVFSLAGVGANSLEASAWSPLLLLDFFGINTVAMQMSQLMGTSQIMIGLATFDPAVTPLRMPDTAWTPIWTLTRMGVVAVSLAVLGLAVALSRREPLEAMMRRQVHARRPALAWLQDRARLLTLVLLPGWTTLMRWPAALAWPLAELRLQWLQSPAGTLALLGLAAASAVTPELKAATAMTGAGLALWGVLLAGWPVMHRGQPWEGLRDVSGPGRLARLGSGLIAALLPALLLAAPLTAHWLACGQLLRAGALLASVLAILGTAWMMGLATRGPRSFLSLWLLLVYLVANGTGVAWLDLGALSGAAGATQATAWAAWAAATGLACWCWTRR